MDRQALIQKMNLVFKSLTPEILYEADESGVGHSIQIISESFKNVSMDERMNIVLKCVKSSPEFLLLDATYDFTYYPLTPNDNKNKNNPNYKLEDGADDVYKQVGKSADI